MKIHILGTKGEIESSAPYHSHQSGLLIDQKLLLDLGEKEFLNYSPKWIFITHLHPDHAFFIKDQEIISPKAKIFAPEGYKDVEMNIVKMEEEIKVDEYKLISLPTHHSKKVESCAYLIQKKDHKILYTGDMIWINKEYHHYFDNIDLVITEGSFIRKNGLIRRDSETGEIYGHTGIPNLMDFFEDYTDHILFIHFGNWFYKDIQKSKKKIKSLAKERSITAHIGYDSLEFDLANLSELK